MSYSPTQLSLFGSALGRAERWVQAPLSLKALLSQDLDFHGQDSEYASHNFHAFPAKFPPQLPRKFILALTEPGDVVLDPMAGSGTTVVEAYLTGRRAIGCDIDPLAALISRVKTTVLDKAAAIRAGQRVLSGAQRMLAQEEETLDAALGRRWNGATKRFVDYWFAPQTQRELLGLVAQIEAVEDVDLRAFLALSLSATIITKSGGVSLAFDLAHTRPHRAKIVYTESGQALVGEDLVDDPSPRVKLLTKTLRSPLEEFAKRLQANVRGLLDQAPDAPRPLVQFADAQSLPLADNSVDLIVTSPPYASNAIDYMRAHKFSLVWFGHPIGELGQRRAEYIGGESTTATTYEPMPPHANAVIGRLAAEDPKKAAVLHRYYSEMRRVLAEMHRVLKPGKVAIQVVGSSVLRGVDTETHHCLMEIGDHLGYEPPSYGVRNLDRNRRMMPAGQERDRESQIQQRMHQEYVLAFRKPAASRQPDFGSL